jgi:peptidoglycan biosynthesis protein MviN/MurJ (putative lipid II flippase)
MRGCLGGLESRRMLASLGKIAVAGAALGAVCAASSHWLLADWATQEFWSKAAALFGTVIAGVLVFAACGAWLKIEELTDMAAGIRRRLARAR